MLDLDRMLVAREALPLSGKRILFCTPRNYAAKLARLLVLRGAVPVWMPTIVIEPMADYAEFDEAIKNLSQYRWLAFTSRNGIQAFFNRLDALALDASVLKDTQIAALGNDAAALEQKGISVDLLPPVTTTKGIVEELERRGENTGRILLPVPQVYGMEEPSVIPEFAVWLSDAGMDVHRVPAYATRRVTEGLDVETQMILDNKLDLIAFTSVAEIESLLFILGDRRDVLQEYTVACYGPVTAGGALERELHVDIVSESYAAFESFIEAMEQHFRG